MKRFNNSEKLTDMIDYLLSVKEYVTVAIDGPCTSGKTTLASLLAEKYGATVFHADDFFLRREQRTPERLSQVGGNLDRERFFCEVIAPLTEKRDISYSPFSCRTQTLGEKISVKIKALNIVEGSYCHHPYFGEAYDLRVFIDIDENEQRKRILMRNPDKAERFFSEWTVKENEYFEKFKIKEKADIVLNDTKSGEA